jgi:hypothetical protein
MNHEAGAIGFPRRAVLNGALVQTRDDLLSLSGVFATAVILALANEIFPDAARSSLGHRVVHGVAVVLAALAALALLDLARRLALYPRRNKSTWLIKAADLGHLLSFAIDARSPGGWAPHPVAFFIRSPSGRFLTPHAEESDPLMVSRGYPSGTWASIVEQPYELGMYEVRVYAAASHWIEMARATLEIWPGANLDA